MFIQPSPPVNLVSFSLPRFNLHSLHSFSRPRHRLPLLMRHPRQLHNPNSIPRIPRINRKLSTPDRLHHILIIASNPSSHSRISPNPFILFLVVVLAGVKLLVGGERAVESLGLDAEGGVRCRHAGYGVFFLGVCSVLIRNGVLDFIPHLPKKQTRYNCETWIGISTGAEERESGYIVPS